MIQDLLGDQINIAFLAAPTNLQHVKAGKIKALAAGPAKRLAVLPDTPALAESMPGFEASSWVGLLAPAGTPQPILAQLHKEYLAVLADPEVKAKLEGQGFEIIASAPDAFLVFVKSESEKLGKVIKDNNVKVE